jgi:transposase-like protein
MIQAFNSLLELIKAFPDEDTCVAHFTSLRWAAKEYCPHCGGEKIYHFSDGKTHKCGTCRKKFSIRVGTIFEDSKIPFQKWFMAIYLTTSHKKGISSIQLSKDIDVTQKTAVIIYLTDPSEKRKFCTLFICSFVANTFLGAIFYSLLHFTGNFDDIFSSR